MYQALNAKSLGQDIAEEEVYTDQFAQCSANVLPEPTTGEFLSGVLSTNNWPTLLGDGYWSEADGWMSIVLDLIVLSSYFSIPIFLLLLLRKTPEARKYRGFFMVFSIFIFVCGITQLINSINIWEPAYKLNGILKALTAVSLVATVSTLIKNGSFKLWNTDSSKLNSELEKNKELKNQRDAFLRNVPCAVAVFDKNMIYMLANKAWCKDYNVKEDEIIGKSHYEVFPEILNMPHWLEKHKKALTGKSINVTKDVFVTGEGETIYLKYRLEPWRDHNDQIGGIIMYTEDITDQIKMQKELEENQKYLQEIFDHSPLGICMVDETGRPFIVNDRMCEIVGYSRKELTSLTFDKFTHPDDVDKDVTLFEKLKRNEIKHYAIDKRYLSKEGRVSHVVLNVSMVSESQTNSRHALALIQDITPRVKAKEESAMIERMLKNLSSLVDETWEVAQMGSWEVNLSTSEAQWSRVIYKIHQLDESEAITMDQMLSMIHNHDLPRVEEVFDLAIREGKGWDMDIRVITAKNTECWIRFIGHPVSMEGQVVRIEGLIKNVDQIKKYNMELTELNAKLEHLVDERTMELASANKELEAFAYSVSHDLRAPLRAIDGFASALMEDYSNSLDKHAQHYIGRIGHNTRKMGSLIDDLLNFSRSARMETRFQTFDIKDKFSGLIVDLFLDKKYDIELNNLGHVYGDKGLLRQVFQNVLDNAVKYSSKEESPKIIISQTTNAEGDIISISDNGVGFESEYSQQIFTIFQRLHSDREFEGTGIGLALCKRILDRHNGRIWAESEKGIGSTFHIFLPFPQNSYQTISKHDKDTVKSDKE